MPLSAEDGARSPEQSGLQELCLYYCNRLSFSEVAKLLERVAGERLICEQTLWKWAQHKAREVSGTLLSEVRAARSLPLPTVDGAVDIYDACSEEVLMMTDAIQVKAQRSPLESVRAKRNEKRR